MQQVVVESSGSISLGTEKITTDFQANRFVAKYRAVKIEGQKSSSNQQSDGKVFSRQLSFRLKQ